MKDYEGARGANVLWVSPDGKHFAAELSFVGDTLPAVIKVLDSATGRVEAHARGSIVAAPDVLGEVLYVDTTDRTHPRLRSTARSAFAVTLDVRPGAFVRFGGYRLPSTAERFVLLREDVDGVALSLRQLPNGEELASRTLTSTELGLLATAVSPTEDVLFLSGKDTAHGSGGVVVALDALTLRDRWRTPWPSGHLFDASPALGVSGDGTRVAAYAPSGILSLDADRGTDARMLDFDGNDGVTLAGVPGRSAIVALRVGRGASARPTCSLETIELPSGKRDELGCPPNAGNAPAAITAVGTAVWVAPGSPPRWPESPTSWGPEVTSLIGK